MGDNEDPLWLKSAKSIQASQAKKKVFFFLFFFVGLKNKVVRGDD